MSFLLGSQTDRRRGGRRGCQVSISPAAHQTHHLLGYRENLNQDEHAENKHRFIDASFFVGETCDVVKGGPTRRRKPPSSGLKVILGLKLLRFRVTEGIHAVMSHDHTNRVEHSTVTEHEHVAHQRICSGGFLPRAGRTSPAAPCRRQHAAHV